MEALRSPRRVARIAGLLYILVGTTMWSLASVGQFAALALPGMADAALRVHGEVQLFSLLFFGVYCVLIGAHVYRSTFLPRAVGVLMAFAGCCYIFDTLSTIVAPSLSSAVSDYILLPGLIGEGALALWLLVFAVDEARFYERCLNDAVAGPVKRSKSKGPG